VVPDWFAASLRPYQQRGVDWLQFLREAGLAGVLADDMGLGKTVQTLAHLAIEKQAGRLTAPALVVCPTSVVGNWAREAERFTPQLRVLPLQGTDRKERFGRIAESDLVISTYPLMTRDYDVLTAQDWSIVILDEAQTVKNPGASMAQAVRQLRAGQRICLTGTPMENHLGELWALFDFMMPGFLGSQQDFGRRFRTPVEKGGDAAVHAALAKRVAPFLLRRNKSEVAADLPPRTEIVENVQMQAPQRAIYEAIRLAMHARVQQAIAEQGLAKSGIVILDALLKMRQACCDPRLLKISGTTTKKAGSAKLERLLELLTTLLEEGRSILLFSQFTSMLALIEDAIKPLGIDYVQLTGDTTDRRTPVDRFQAGKVKLFLISLKAGGVGLNLTAADTVIHYDPWWNPAVENQATDRAHRIGQTKSVFVHRLITENSIEEKMEVLKARKSALAEGILSGAGANALRMTEADVTMLFS
jgi:SNF2 family DNA or RNA helicase